MINKYKKIHMMGIGGIGMSGIAKVLIKQGFNVSGCDVASNSLTEELSFLGADIYIGHDLRHISHETDLVVYSSAIKEDNPEFAYAKSISVLVWKRAKILAELVRNKTCIAVTGTHGKTTISSMITCILKEAGVRPNFIIGGELCRKEYDGRRKGGSYENAYWGNSSYCVVEADESDGSQVFIEPDIAVIANIDRDHLENYSDFGDISRVMMEFTKNLKGLKILIGCAEDELVWSVLEKSGAETLCYGFGEDMDLYAVNINSGEWKMNFEAIYKNISLGAFTLNIPGRHNILNALAAIAVALKLGIKKEIISNALYKYSGVRRRLEVILNNGRLLIIDDYAHHPEEIKAVVSAVRGNYPDRRIIGVFQPHRFSRTRFLGSCFAPSFKGLDFLVLTDIYGAGEKPIPGISGEIIYNDVLGQGYPEVKSLKTAKIAEFIINYVKKDDIVLVMGAGDITKTAHEIKTKVKNEETRPYDADILAEIIYD